MDNSEKLGSIYVEGAGQQIANPITTEEGVDLKQIYTTVPEDKGRIADPNQAQELAKTEDTLGQSARVAQEKSMEFVANEGMTEIQKRNSELMDGVEQKYPNACIKHVDEKGRKVLVANTGPTGTLWGGRSLVFTKDAVILLDSTNIGGPKMDENVDWNMFGDELEKSLKEGSKDWITNFRGEKEARLWMGNIGSEKYVESHGGRTGGHISIEATQMDVDRRIEDVKNILSIAEGLGLEQKKRETAPPMKSASELLSAL